MEQSSHDAKKASLPKKQPEVTEMFHCASNEEIMQTVLETMRVALPRYKNSRADLLNMADGLHKALAGSDQKEMTDILRHLVESR